MSESTLVSDLLSEHELAPVQTLGSLRVMPILSRTDAAFDYRSLKSALKTEGFKITEVDESGRVPNLAVHNDLDDPVLMIDGEEIEGAKQNRVFNTAILVDARSKLEVPVSCTESGRWAYRKANFGYSGHMAEPSLRMAKKDSTYRILKSTGRYGSDQSEVWRSVDRVLRDSGTSSSSSAMRDAYEAHRTKIDGAMDAFERIPGQRGAVFLQGEDVVGLEMVSRPEAYADLHESLIRSHVILADLKVRSFESDAEELATAFMTEMGDVEAEAHESVGLGTSHQFRSESLIGAVLEHEGESIHVNCFRHNGPNGRTPETDSYRVDQEEIERLFAEANAHTSLRNAARDSWWRRLFRGRGRDDGA